MPRYVVTGGADGVSGVEVDGRRYEPGDTVEIPTGKKDWRIAAGYLELASKAKRARNDSTRSVADDQAAPENETHAKLAPKTPAGGKK